MNNQKRTPENAVNNIFRGSFFKAESTKKKSLYCSSQIPL